MAKSFTPQVPWARRLSAFPAEPAPPGPPAGTHDCGKETLSRRNSAGWLTSAQGSCPTSLLLFPVSAKAGWGPGRAMHSYFPGAKEGPARSTSSALALLLPMASDACTLSHSLPVFQGWACADGAGGGSRGVRQ